jgi:hypothetical protein
MFRSIYLLPPLLSLGLLSCHQSEDARLFAGKDVASYKKENGQFVVTCKNGLIEYHDEYEIRNNQVCKPGYFMEINEDLFLMSADGAGENCYVSIEGKPLIVPLEGAPGQLAEDTSVTISYMPSRTQCYLRDGLVLKSDRSKLRFGFTDGRKVNWLTDGTGALTNLEGQVVDAVQLTGSDKIYMVTAEPHALVVFDPGTAEIRSIPLERKPTSLDVSADASFAVVGHDAAVSAVDLTLAQVKAVHVVNVDVLDVILSQDKEHAYLMPKRDQWANLSQVNLTTGVNQEGSGRSIYAGTVGKLHPSGRWIYGANNGLSPSDIEKYDVTGAVISYLYDSPYHGDYSMCGNLWFSETGDRLYTRCGNIFATSEEKAKDMLYIGKLADTKEITSLDDAQSENVIVALVAEKKDWFSGEAEYKLKTWHRGTYELKATDSLKDLLGKDFVGSFVFIDEAGDRALLVGSKAGVAGIYALPLVK